MPDLINKLSTYAALLGVIGAIGGGFYAWGEFNTRLESLENVSYEATDLSGINNLLLYHRFYQFIELNDCF